MMPTNRFKGTITGALATALLTITLAIPLSIAPVGPSMVGEGPMVDLIDVTSPTQADDDAISAPASQPQNASLSAAADAPRS